MTEGCIGDSIEANVFEDYAPMMAAINFGVLLPAGGLTNALLSGCDNGDCTFSQSQDAAFHRLRSAIPARTLHRAFVSSMRPV